MNSVLKELYNLVKYLSWNKISCYSQKIHLYKCSTQYVFYVVVCFMQALILIHKMHYFYYDTAYVSKNVTLHTFDIVSVFLKRLWWSWPFLDSIFTVPPSDVLYIYEDIRKCSNFKAKTFGFFFTKNYSVAKNIIII